MKLLPIIRGIFDPIRFRIWDWQMGNRKSEEEMWVWSDVSDRQGHWSKQLQVFGRPNRLFQVLPWLGMCSSNGEAQRLIKAGAIEIRDWALDEPWQVIDLHTPLPGSPTYIRRGKAVYGVRLFWLPPAGVSEKFGAMTFRDGV
jgi:hypothetical protein